MAENTKIEWAKHTLNIWWGCDEVHEGCDNCYAKVFSNRFDEGNPLWGKDVPRRRINSAFKALAKFQKKAAAVNEIHSVFVGSMMDIFEKSMPLLNPVDGYYSTGDLRKELFSRIEKGMYPNLLFLLLTKRPSNIHKYVPARWLDKPMSNVMYGTSVVNQSTYDNLVRLLIRVKGRKFLSIEPQLDHIELNQKDSKEIDWIIQGGESGNQRRPFDVAWARSMKKQCKDLGIPYFFKQIDKVKPIPKDLLVREFAESA